MQQHGTTRVRWSRRGEEAIAQSPGRVSCDDASQFRSRGVRWTFDDIIVSHTLQSPCSIAPTHDDASGDSDYISALFILSGGYRVRESNRALAFASGVAGWMPGWTRVEAENLHASRLARVSVPRSSLIGADAGHGPFGLFAGAGVLAAPALAFVLELMQATDDQSLSTAELSVADGSAEHPAHPASTMLAQLVAGLFLEQAGYRPDSADLAEGLWAQAAALIDGEHADPALDPSDLATRLHVSLRQLQRTFAAHDSTVADAIRQRRVQAATAVLASATGRGLPLGEIAAMTGFSSIKELRSGLRARHGVTPRDLRAHHLNGNFQVTSALT